MKRFLSIVLAGAMAMGLASCKGNDNTSDWAYIKDKGEMVIGMTIFAPMNYYDDDDKTLIGFETDFAAAVCAKIEIAPKFVEINWGSKEAELDSKSIDCIWNGMTITDELKENTSISTPYMSNRQIIVTKAENAEKYKESVDGANIVAEQGSAGESLATGNEFFASANFTAVDTQSKALMEVASGIADAAVIDYVAAVASIGEGTDYKDLVIVDIEGLGEQEEYGIAFRKGSDVTEKVNAAIEELKADGTLNEIAEKYGLADLLITE